MSERIILTPENIEEAANKAAKVLRAGGVVLYPKDTLYALGAAYGQEEKVYAIKNRDEKRPLSYVVADIDSAAAYAPVTPLAQKLADVLLPGKLTIVLSDNFSVRVPVNIFCLALTNVFDAPYTATSANRAGEESLRSVEAILTQLGDTAKNIDLLIDAGELPVSPVSTVVDARGKTPVILREGAVAVSDIMAAAG